MADTTQPQREMTFGEKAVGLTFNPSNDENVQKVKTAYAAIIDQLNDLKQKAITDNNSEAVRMFSVAITEAQTSQMWAVKAITLWAVKAITWQF